MLQENNSLQFDFARSRIGKIEPRKCGSRANSKVLGATTVLVVLSMLILLFYGTGNWFSLHKNDFSATSKAVEMKSILPLKPSKVSLTHVSMANSGSARSLCTTSSTFAPSIPTPTQESNVTRSPVYSTTGLQNTSTEATSTTEIPSNLSSIDPATNNSENVSVSITQAGSTVKNEATIKLPIAFSTHSPTNVTRKKSFSYSVEKLRRAESKNISQKAIEKKHSNTNITDARTEKIPLHDTINTHELSKRTIINKGGLRWNSKQEQRQLPKQGRYTALAQATKKLKQNASTQTKKQPESQNIFKNVNLVAPRIKRNKSSIANHVALRHFYKLALHDKPFKR